MTGRRLERRRRHQGRPSIISEIDGACGHLEALYGRAAGEATPVYAGQVTATVAHPTDKQIRDTRSTWGGQA